jgi:hypothetical protein
MKVHQPVSWVTVVFALTLGVISSAARSEDGCSKDTDCKGDRVCNAQKQCADPKSAASSTVMAWLKVAEEAEKAVQDAKNSDKRPASSNDQPSPAANPQPASANYQPTPAANRQVQAVYRPAPAVAKVCATPLGVCPMMVAVPQGSSCGCSTPRGAIGGIAR